MKKRHYISLAILLAGIFVSVWIVLHPRQLPLEECGDLYRRYAADPHIEVAFIRDFPVNDTLALDVTTLKALDTIGWDSLMQYFNIPPLPDFILNKISNGEDQILVRLAPKGNPSLFADTSDLINNNVLAISILNQTVGIFHTRTLQDQIAVQQSKYDHN